MATLPQYNLAWETGEDKLMIVSVGTGSAPSIETVISGSHTLTANAQNLPGVLMYGASVDQDINCRMIGRCVYGAPIDRELGDMIPRQSGDPRRAFLYARYNADISEKGLAELGLSDVDPDAVSQLDSIKAIDDLRRVGRAVARDVKMGAFEPFLQS